MLNHIQKILTPYHGALHRGQTHIQFLISAHLSDVVQKSHLKYSLLRRYKILAIGLTIVNDQLMMFTIGLTPSTVQSVVYTIH